MDILNELGKKISETTESAVKATKELAESAVKGTKDFADTAKLNSQVTEEQKTVKNLYTQLGKKYYEAYGASETGEFSDVCSAISRSMEKIEALREEIKRIKGQ